MAQQAKALLYPDQGCMKGASALDVGDKFEVYHHGCVLFKLPTSYISGLLLHFTSQTAHSITVNKMATNITPPARNNQHRSNIKSNDRSAAACYKVCRSLSRRTNAFQTQQQQQQKIPLHPIPNVSKMANTLIGTSYVDVYDCVPAAAQGGPEGDRKAAETCHPAEA
jgi:hypothetical protein